MPTWESRAVVESVFLSPRLVPQKHFFVFCFIFRLLNYRTRLILSTLWPNKLPRIHQYYKINAASIIQFTHHYTCFVFQWEQTVLLKKSQKCNFLLVIFCTARGGYCSNTQNSTLGSSGILITCWKFVKMWTLLWTDVLMGYLRI